METVTVALPVRSYRVLSRIKEEYKAKNEAEALSILLREHEEASKSEVSPKYLQKLSKIMQNPKLVKIDDFRKHFGLK